MKLLFTNVHLGRAQQREARPAPAGDDLLGRGMDMALTIGAFVVIGLLIDRWLGTQPLFIILMTLFAAVGQFVRMKYVYDAQMERLEAERRSARQSTSGRPTEEAA